MKKGGEAGGRTITGLRFEKKVNILDLLESIPGYEVRKNPEKAGFEVLFENKLVARCFRKNEFYNFLEENGINWRQIISKRLLPDDALLVIVRKTFLLLRLSIKKYLVL